MASLVPPPGIAHHGPGAVPGGGQRASGSGCADGGDVRPARSRRDPSGPRFDVTPAAGGYAWWYVDGLSDDGKQAITLIAFIGSVFSPYYAFARRRGRPDPLNHCALNVALYNRGAHRWAMTERGAGRVQARYASLAIGTSVMRWTGDALEITVDERCAPLPHRVQGVVKLYPVSLCETAFDLDADRLHQWRPYAPCARIDVNLSSPRLRWQGAGYFDANTGAVPLEDTFARWHWSRSIDANRCALLYDVEPRAGEARSLALGVTGTGKIEALEPPPPAVLPGTRWRIARTTRADAGRSPAVIETLEDAPFYARSLVKTTLLGETRPAMHESLDLDRFRRGWVQCLLPFRMPRTG